MELQCQRCNKFFSRKKSDINRGRVKFCSRECSDSHKIEQAILFANHVLSKGKKQCKVCNKTKQLHEFPVSKSSRTGYFSYCTLCRREINRRQDIKRNSEKRDILIAQRHRAHLKREFGISIEDYETLLASQNHSCAICMRNPGGKMMAVDHNHDSGKIRGILCENCNRGIGMFADDTVRLENANRYLRIHNSTNKKVMSNG